MKGLKRLWKPDALSVMAIGLAVFAFAYFALKPWVRKKSEGLENRNQSLRTLFHLPLICSAALLVIRPWRQRRRQCHRPAGGNPARCPDRRYRRQGRHSDLGHGHRRRRNLSRPVPVRRAKLIRMVGEQITKMNPMRAFCVALSAAITVIIASALGLPVSSTHIAVGAVFGVGIFREYYTGHSKRRRQYVRKHAREPEPLATMPPSPQELRIRKLVRRSHFMTIIAAWVITVPAAALLAGGIFLVLSYFL